MRLPWKREQGSDVDFESMSIDELIEYKCGVKAQINALREQKKAAHVVYQRKLERWHIEEAIKRAGLDGLVVIPGPAALKLEGKGNDVSTSS